jgi:hypothetical protein
MMRQIWMMNPPAAFALLDGLFEDIVFCPKLEDALLKFGEVDFWVYGFVHDGLRKYASLIFGIVAFLGGGFGGIA